jgi:hypothetical protein
VPGTDSPVSSNRQNSKIFLSCKFLIYTKLVGSLALLVSSYVCEGSIFVHPRGFAGLSLFLNSGLAGIDGLTGIDM